MNKTTRLSLVLFAAVALGGCASVSEPVQQTVMARNSWIGSWFGESVSYYGHKSSSGIQINADGSGYIVNSSIFEPRHRPSFWVSKHPFTWTQTGPGALTLNVGGSENLAGDGDWGIFAKRRGEMGLSASNDGLHLNGFGLEKSTLHKYPSPLPGAMDSEIVNETRTRAMAAGGNEDAGHRPSFAEIAAAGLGGYQAGLQMGAAIRPVKKIGSYDHDTYFVGNRGQAMETMANPSGPEAQIRQAYPDGKAWDVQALNGNIWKIYYGAPTSIKDQMLASGNLVTPSGNDPRNRVLRGPYKPTSGMRVGLVAIDPPSR